MLPRSITVMGDKIAVKEALRGIQAFEDEHSEVMGLAFILEDLILIRKDLPERAKPKVLAHEITHIAMAKNGIDQYLTREQQEVICQMFSQLYFELKKQGL